jgi:glycosidase
LYWTAKGVDGFRYDMAEMVPYEFWSYMNSAIKVKNPDAFLLAEVYNPNEYRNYIRLGKMDYLYDKVELYDKLKEIVQGRSQTDPITTIQNGMADIEHHMLHFLDNHDEQRMASPEFAGTPEKGKPLMVVSATISTSPTMIYFGQEVGEAGNENGGFGTHSRTSIFDYVGVPNHQRWMNEGKFDGGQLSQSEKDLRDFYKRLLNFTLNSTALMGQYQEIHGLNRYATEGYFPEVYSYVRWSDTEKLIIIANFSSEHTSHFELKIPKDVIQKWNLKDGNYTITDQLYQKSSLQLQVINGEGKVQITIAPSESFIYKL